MSSGTVPPPPRPAEPQPGPPSYEAFIDDRLRRTRRQVKGVDVGGGLIVLLIGTLAYLLAAAVVDHWVVSGGLGFWGRLWLLLGLVVGAGWYFARRVSMPLIGRINPIFAAYTIEQSSRSLKNSLINFLLLRAHRREVPPPVYQAIEQRAAADLSQIEIEAAVDRMHVIRLGYVLAGMVAVCCLYLVLSPKSLLSSAARVLWPWSGIAAPTRVTIEDVKPGDAAAFHGEFVTVSAEVRGVNGDTVALYYSTADGQSIDQSIPMMPSADGYGHRYECRLPPEELGLQQNVSYYLTAGDYTTRRFTIDVQTAPTIGVDQIEYNYPAYTGLPTRTVKRQGDLRAIGDVRAIEGTQITIRAAANRAIRRAEIDLGCTGLHELSMQPQHPEGTRSATGRFTLRLDPNDPNLPEYDSYQLRFRDDAGRLNPRPTRHRIEVVRDLPPEIQIVEPQQEEVQLDRAGRLQIRVRAEDPDFALRRVVLKAECGGRSLVIPPLMEKPHQGQFQQSHLFEPARARLDGDASQPGAAGLKAGDRVRYWAEAEDNKEPTPGRGTSAQQWITIVEPSSGQPPAEQPDGTGQAAGQRSQDNQKGSPDQQHDQGQQPGEDHPPDAAEKPKAGEQSAAEEGGAQPQGQQGDTSSHQPAAEGDSSKPGKSGDKSDSGTAGKDPQQQPDGQSEQPGKPVNPETQPGDAFEKILKDRQEQQQNQQKQGNEQPGGQQGAKPQEGGNPDPSKKPDGGQPSGGNQQASGKPDGGKQQEGGKPDASKKPDRGQPSGGNQQGGGKPDAGKQEEGGKPEGGKQQEAGKPDAGKEQEGGKPDAGKRQEGGKPDGGKEQGGTKPEGGGQQDGQQQSPGAGQPSSEETGPPAAQGENRPREKQPGEPGKNPGESQQSAQSPSTSRDQSDSQGDTSGDRSGGGEQGGGQRSKQPGAGAAGSQTEAQRGGSAAKQRGDGQTGTRGGNQVETARKTGSSATRRGGPGSGGREEPGGIGPGERKSDGSNPGGAQRPQENPRDGGQAGSGVSSGPGARGQGNPVVGGGPGEPPEGPPPSETTTTGGDEPNLDYARRATDLALEHLKDQMNQQDSALLEKLGWTREEARKFVQKWEQMKREAAKSGPEGEAARRQLDGALKSLGLRPRGTQLKGGGTTTDKLQGLREASRFDPPSDWSELFRAYSRGVAGGGRE